jgi:hypothetical protein
MTYGFVNFQVYSFQLAESNQVCSNQNLEFSSLGFTLFTVARMTLMLQTDPKLVHLGEVGENEFDGFTQITLRAVFKLDYNILSTEVFST